MVVTDDTDAAVQSVTLKPNFFYCMVVTRNFVTFFKQSSTSTSFDMQQCSHFSCKLLLLHPVFLDACHRSAAKNFPYISCLR